MAAPPPVAAPPAVAAARPTVVATTARADVQSGLCYFTDRVELLGVRVCGAVDSSLMRKILDALKERRPDGKRVALSGTKLVHMTGSDGGQNSIANAVKRFREQLKELFPTAGVLPCKPEDVVLSGGPGYRLNDKLPICEPPGSGKPSATSS